jgi:uncharacterized peroxidase-related enzyme
MAFIGTVSPEGATGAVRALYDQARARFGYLPNMTRLFSHRPKVADAWSNLLKAIREEGGLDDRRYELATVAAARALRSSYCMLAHGAILAKDFYDVPQATAIARDFRDAALSDADVAMMAVAEKVARDATGVTRADIDALRRHGFSDPEIFDVCAVAAARCFYSKLLDALGAQPDAQYRALDGALRDTLTVGRPISGPETAPG